MSIYVYPRLSRWDFGAFRVFGPGLGNMLFPWARAVVFAYRHNLTPIWPTWPQLKVGPWLRNEPDKRHYADLFRRPRHYVGGVRKAGILLAGHRITEPDTDWQPMQRQAIRRPQVYVFGGMDGFFEKLLADHVTVRRELLRITASPHKTGMDFDFSDSISVHIRRGDFNAADENGLREGIENIRLPLRWIKDTIAALRSTMGQQTRVWIFSDGSDVELKELLSMPNVERLSFGSALSDLLALSCANVLIASSSFSMWASYLGRMPVIWFPGQLRQLLYGSGDRYREIERDYGENIQDQFLSGSVD